MVVSDRVIVMDKGRIQQIGSPQEIYDRPMNRFVAQFIGSANIFPARVREVDSARNRVAGRSRGGRPRVPLKSAYFQEQHPQAGAGGFVCIRNESISVLAQGSPAGDWPQRYRRHRATAHQHGQLCRISGGGERQRDRHACAALDDHRREQLGRSRLRRRELPLSGELARRRITRSSPPWPKKMSSAPGSAISRIIICGRSS